MVASPNRKMQRVLQISMVLTLAYVVATFYFGLRAHSLALISEAGHNVSDLLAIALSFVAVYFQARPATDQKTFGYQRAGVLAAFVNAVTLVVLSAWIAIEAIHRIARSGGGAAASDDVCCGGRRADERHGGDAAVALLGRRQYPQRLSAYAGRYALDGGGDRGRRGDPVHRHDVDRSGAVDPDCGDDSLEFGGDHSRDVEHSAGRDAAQPAAGRGSRGDGFGRAAFWMCTICMSGVWGRSRMRWRAM